MIFILILFFIYPSIILFLLQLLLLPLFCSILLAFRPVSSVLIASSILIVSSLLISLHVFFFFILSAIHPFCTGLFLKRH